MQKKYLTLLLACALLNSAYGNEEILSPTTVTDPCGGDNSLLAILDRPTTGDSTCVVKPGNVVVEMGYQYQSLIAGGHGYNLPEAEIRFGLPKNTEFVILPANFFHQNSSGLGATVVGIKHEIGYTSQWVVSAESLLTLASGSADYGSSNYGAVVNGLVSYDFTQTISLTASLGVGSQTLATNASGQRYTSVNPDLVLTWQPRSRWQLYGEIYGQTETGPSQGPGYNINGGIQYLLTRYFEVDAEEGVTLSGNLGGFNHYFGVGVGLTL